MYLIWEHNYIDISADKLNFRWRSYYLTCYRHGVTELCFSSAEFSKHFCYTSCLNATCKDKEIQWSLNTEGFDTISDN